MTALLFMTGVLLLVSGGVKVRSGLRAGLGVQPLTYLELLASVLSCIAAAAGLGTSGAGIWVVPAGVLLVLVSSVLFSMRLTEYRRRRAESEGSRLENYVKYMSGTADTSESDS
jgi:uncharacterized membrane protein YqgA involved in biofilm formation